MLFKLNTFVKLKKMFIKLLSVLFIDNKAKDLVLS